MKKNYSLVLAAVILMLLPTKNIAQAPSLGNASSFAVFTSVGGFNNVGTTTVTGNVGTNVGSFNAFPPGTLNGAIHVANATSALAAADVITAYNALGAATCTTVLGVSIINQTLTPNVYCTGAASTLNGNLTLDGQGNPNALFIIKIGGAFATGSTASVTLINAASICNVYWQINGQFDLGSNSIFRGTVIVNGAVNLLSGAALIGRVLSQSGAITLDNNMVTMPPPSVASVISAGSSTTFCSGSSVVLSGNVNGTWNNSAITAAITVTASGDYYVTSNNACGNVSSNHITVTVSATPTLAVTGGSICSGNSFTVVPTGAPAGSTYSINGGSNFTVSPPANTNYTVIATSSNNCVSSNSVITVAVSATPTLAVTGGNICSGNSFTVVPTGAPAGSTYSINGGNNFTVSPAANTNYTVIATSSNNCVSSNSVITVAISGTPTLAVTGGSICSGNSFTVVPTGAPAGSTYSINGGNNFTVSPAANTNYTVIATSSNNCVSSNSVITVMVSATPILAVNSGTICSGLSFTIIPTGAANGTYSITGNNFTVSPVTGNYSYSVTGTSSLGCVGSNTAVSAVLVNALPTVSVNSGAICAGEIFTIMPSGANTYIVTGGNFTISPTSQSSYSVTGTDTNGCVSSNTAISTVSVNTLPTVSVNSGAICAGKIFTITPSGASIYTVTGGNFMVSPTSQTSYSVTGTSSVGCVSGNTAVSTVTVNALPTVSVNSGVICSGKLFTITPSGANTYTVTGGNFTVSPTSQTSYSVTGTSSLGCVSSNTAVSTVSVNALPNLSVTGTETICAGETTTLTASGASTYTWNTGTWISYSPSISSSCMTTMTYTVSGTNTLGCVSSETVSVYVDACTGIDKFEVESLKLKVYPNPNNGEFAIDSEENIQIIVMNSIGKVVYQQTTTNAKTEISLQGMSVGIYFIKAISNNHQQIVKMIKQ